MAARQRQVCIMARRGGREGSGAIYDPRDNVSDRVVPVHAETGDVGIWWPSVTSGNTKLFYRFKIHIHSTYRVFPGFLQKRN